MMFGQGDSSEPIVTAHAVEKRFGDLLAVAGVDLEITPNECVAVLGPNGAGKTTLMRMIYSAIEKTGGELLVFGRPPMVQRKQINAQVGVVFQDNNLDEELNASECLEVHAMYCGLDLATARRRAAALLAWMGLTPKARSTIRALSGGMVRRLMIARALVNSPRLLILDEPTTGLDPQVRHSIWGLLRDLKRAGMTILLTTHYMEEAQQLADRVMIMHGGKILVTGEPNALVTAQLERYVLQASGLAAVPCFNGRIRHERSGDADYFYSNDEQALQQLHRDLPTKYVVLRHANLEDVFLKFTGRGLAE